MQYQVIDRHTQIVIGTYKTRSRASNKVDKLDNAYGGYRYSVKLLNDDGTPLHSKAA